MKLNIYHNPMDIYHTTHTYHRHTTPPLTQINTKHKKPTYYVRTQQFPLESLLKLFNIHCLGKPIHQTTNDSN